jgi:hypothetical protein
MDDSIKYFERLKELIVLKMQQSYPAIPDSISDWKGQNIVDFQTELRVKQNEQISEKWFYTHMKANNKKLPRIDILNFLSKFAGFTDWNDFKYKNREAKTFTKKAKDKSNRVFYLLPLLTLVGVFVFYLAFSVMYTQEYTFCFYDNDTKKPIENQIIEISILSDSESPVSYLCDNTGCFSIRSNERILRFVVETPYYRTDTVVRTLNKFNRTENIKLRLDDYAVMIQYFSTSNVKDWLKRREDLSEMISDSAKIFQVLNKTVGMEMYNKWEFINKLTLPTTGLRNIEIIDSKYEDGKITHLRFTQNEQDQ